MSIEVEGPGQSLGAMWGHWNPPSRAPSLLLGSGECGVEPGGWRQAEGHPGMVETGVLPAAEAGDCRAARGIGAAEFGMAGLPAYRSVLLKGT